MKTNLIMLAWVLFLSVLVADLAPAQSDLGNVRARFVRAVDENPSAFVTALEARLKEHCDQSTRQAIVRDLFDDMGVDWTLKDDPHADEIEGIKAGLLRAGLDPLYVEIVKLSIKNNGVWLPADEE